MQDLIDHSNNLSRDRNNAGILVVQTDEKKPDIQPWNGWFRLNSGFYYVKTSPRTIKAFDDIIISAMNETLTEQPHFFLILCGSNGEYRIGNKTCLRDGMVSELLDPRLYPNGKAFDIWNSSNIEIDYPNIYVLHNNWIVGVDSKFARRKKHGYDYFAEDKEICKRSWFKF